MEKDDNDDIETFHENEMRVCLALACESVWRVCLV